MSPVQTTQNRRMTSDGPSGWTQTMGTVARANPQFVHHYFKPDETMEIIISQKAKNWNYFFTFNSYILLFFSLVSYCCYLVYAALFTQQFRTSSLTRRIQTIIVLLLLLVIGYLFLIIDCFLLY